MLPSEFFSLGALASEWGTVLIFWILRVGEKLILFLALLSIGVSLYPIIGHIIGHFHMSFVGEVDTSHIVVSIVTVNIGFRPHIWNLAKVFSFKLVSCGQAGTIGYFFKFVIFVGKVDSPSVTVNDETNFCPTVLNVEVLSRGVRPFDQLAFVIELLNRTIVTFSLVKLSVVGDLFKTFWFR